MNQGAIHKYKTKKAAASRLDNVFASLRKQLPRRYMADLKNLLPGLNSKEIWYAMEARCQDLELKERVKDAMSQLVQIIQVRRQKFAMPSPD